MSKVAASASKLSRGINTAAISSQRKAGALLMPKYAELLRNRRTAEHSDSSRGLTTAHRPTPQPSLANRPKPLMQSFHTSPSPSSTPSTHLDAAVLPNMASAASTASAGAGDISVPLLPDNYGAFNVLETADSVTSEPTILAANPDIVIPGAPMTEIEGMGIDGVELKFAHEPAGAERGDESTLLGDLWKGMVDDVFGPRKTTA